MATIADNLTRLAEIKEDIRQAINDKGVEVTTAEPFTAYADKIAEIPQGGGEREDAPLLDVNFYDYDGWRCYSYYKEDFLALIAMPEQPQNEGFIAQGWNWTLEQAQAHVRKYRYLEIGAYCATADGKTRLYISVASDTWLCQLQLTCSNFAGLLIEWGDGITTVPTSNITNHTYSKGNYVITITAEDGITYKLGRGTSYNNLVGNWYSGDNQYQAQIALQRMELAASVTGFINYSLSSCYALQGWNMPRGCANGSGHSNINNVRYLMWNEDASFSSVSVERISIGANYAGSITWGNLYNLRRITPPDGLTAYGGNGMANSNMLDNIAIPDTVTSIGVYCFTTYQVEEVTIGAGVTSISANAFGGCVALRKVVMKPTTPPTIQANTFRPVPWLTFYVPHGCLEAYQQATNWAAYASRMVEMEEEV